MSVNVKKVKIIYTIDKGRGQILEDLEFLCKEDEVLVKFDLPFYIGSLENRSKYAHLMPTFIEAVKISDLIERYEYLNHLEAGD